MPEYLFPVMRVCPGAVSLDASLVTSSAAWISLALFLSLGSGMLVNSN